MFTIFGKLLDSRQESSALRLFLSSAGATFKSPPKKGLSLKNVAFSLTASTYARGSSFIKGTVGGVKEELGLNFKDLATVFFSGINPILGFIAHSARAQLSGFDRVAYSIEESTETLSSKLDSIKAAIEEGTIVRHLKKFGFLANTMVSGLRLLLKGEEIFRKATYGYRMETTGKPLPGMGEIFEKQIPLSKRIGIIIAGSIAGRFIPDFLKGPVGATILETSILKMLEKETRKGIAKTFKEKGVFEAIGEVLKANTDAITDALSREKGILARFIAFTIKRGFVDAKDTQTLKKRTAAALRLLSEEYRMLEYERASGILLKFYRWIGLRFPKIYQIIEFTRNFGPAFLMAFLDTIRSTTFYKIIFSHVEKAAGSLIEKIFENRRMKALKEKFGQIAAAFGEKFGKIVKKFLGPFGWIMGKISRFLFGEKENPIEKSLSNIYNILSESKNVFSSFISKFGDIFSSMKEYFRDFSKFKALPVINKFFKKESSEKSTNENLKEANEKLEEQIKQQKNIQESIEKVNKNIEESSKQEGKRDFLSMLGSVFGKGLGLAGNLLSGLAGFAAGRGIGGIFSKAGRVFSRIGLRGFGVLGGLAGGGYLIHNLIKGEKSENRLLGTLGDATTGALSGATIGSVIPGVGTLTGAAIGGALGLGTGLWRNYLKPMLNDISKKTNETFDQFKSEIDVMSKTFEDFDKNIVKEGKTGFKDFSLFAKLGLQSMSAFGGSLGMFTSLFKDKIAPAIEGAVSGAKEFFHENVAPAISGAKEFFYENVAPTISSVSKSIKEAFLRLAGKRSASEFKGNMDYVKEVLTPKNQSKIPYFYGKYYTEMAGITREHAIAESIKAMKKFQTELGLDNDLMAMYLAKFDVESSFNPFIRTGAGPTQTASGLGQLIDSTRLKLLKKTAARFKIDISGCKGSNEEQINCITHKILENKHKTGIENLVQLETYLAILHNSEQKIGKTSLHSYLRALKDPRDKWLLLRLYHAHPATAMRIFSAYKRGELDRTVASVLAGDPKANKYLEQLAVNVSGKRHAPHTITVGDIVRAFGGNIERIGKMGYIAHFLEKTESYASSQPGMSLMTPNMSYASNMSLMTPNMSYASNMSLATPNIPSLEKTITEMESRKTPPQISPQTQSAKTERKESKNKKQTTVVNENKNVVNNPINSGNFIFNFFNFGSGWNSSRGFYGVDDFTLRG